MKLKKPFRRLGFHLLCLAATWSARSNYAGMVQWGKRLGWADFYLRRRLRRRLIDEISTLGDQVGQAKMAAHADTILAEAMVTNDRALLEITALYLKSPLKHSHLPEIKLRNVDLLDELRDLGRGIILLGLHMGNGLALARHVQANIGPVHVVFRESNKVSPNFFRDGIARLGLSPINASSPDGGIRPMIKALRSGETIMILMDQGQKEGGIMTQFLGKQMPLPRGPIELARRTGAPILPVFLTGVSDNGWTFDCLEPIYVESTGGTFDELAKLIRVMESHILRYPQWWSWHQRRWVKYPLVSAYVESS